MGFVQAFNLAEPNVFLGFSSNQLARGNSDFTKRISNRNASLTDDAVGKASATSASSPKVVARACRKQVFKPDLKPR
jgi:hypothetical protein